MSTLMALSKSLLLENLFFKSGYLLCFESDLSELRFCIDSFLVTVVLDLFLLEIMVFIFRNDGATLVALSYLSIFYEALSSWLLVSVTFFLDPYLIVLPFYNLEEVIRSFLILSAPTLAGTVAPELSVLLSRCWLFSPASPSLSLILSDIDCSEHSSSVSSVMSSISPFVKLAVGSFFTCKYYGWEKLFSISMRYASISLVIYWFILPLSDICRSNSSCRVLGSSKFLFKLRFKLATKSSSPSVSCSSSLSSI